MTFTTFECTHGIYKSNGNVSGGSRGFAFGGFFFLSNFPLSPPWAKRYRRVSRNSFFFSLFLNIATCLSFSLKLVITASQRKSIDPTCANPPPSKRRKKKERGCYKTLRGPKDTRNIKSFSCLPHFWELPVTFPPKVIFFFVQNTQGQSKSLHNHIIECTLLSRVSFFFFWTLLSKKNQKNKTKIKKTKQ